MCQVPLIKSSGPSRVLLWCKIFAGKLHYRMRSSLLLHRALGFTATQRHRGGLGSTK